MTFFAENRNKIAAIDSEGKALDGPHDLKMRSRKGRGLLPYYIVKDRPDSARRVAETIVQGVGALDTFPDRGRRGRVGGTRELVFASRRHETEE